MAIDRIEDEPVGEYVSPEAVGERPESGEVTPDVETERYIEQVEAEGEQVSTGASSVLTDDQGSASDAVLQTDDSQLPDDAVVLPMTQAEFEEGLHMPIVRAARWLAEWCGYMIKKMGDKVFFRG